MAKLAAVVDSIDTVPENLRDLYVEADGKFRLDAEGVEDVSGLKSTLEKLKRDAKEAKDALKRFDGMDPDEFQRFKQTAEEAEAAKLSEVERLEAKYKREMEKLTGDLSKRDGFIEKLTIENELNAAIEKAGILPEHRRAVRALLKEAGAKTVAEGDGYRGYLGDTPIAEYVAEWAKSDEAAHYVAAGDVATGSGAEAGRSGKGSKSLKEMGDKDRMEYIDKHGLEKYKQLLATG